MVLDNRGYGRGILMDLSKAFGIINHNLLIAKLHVSSFSDGSLKLIRCYITKGWQRTKLDTDFFKWTEILLKDFFQKSKQIKLY